MRSRDAYKDDDGQRWEVVYEQVTSWATEEDGTLLLDERGKPIPNISVEEFRYRREGDSEWLALPPFATIAEDQKITFCFFDEDEDTEELTFWEVRS